MKPKGVTPYPTDVSEEGWDNVDMLEEKEFDGIDDINNFPFEEKGDTISGILRSVVMIGPWRVFVIQSKKHGYVKVCTKDYPMLRSALAYVGEGYLISIEYLEDYEIDADETMMHFDIKYVKGRDLVMSELDDL